MNRYTVTTATPLTVEQQQKIRDTFCKKTGEDIAVTFLVNDELIGGMTIFDGVYLYDGSIKYRLEKIKNKAEVWKKN